MITAKAKFQGKLQSDEIYIKLAEGKIEKAGRSFRLNELMFDAPVSGTIYGTLLNYKGALELLGEAVHEAPYKAAPKAPVLYIKPANTINSHSRPVLLPEGVEALEIGAALGIVIGRTATRLKEEDALDYVAGYTIVNDVSVPHESVYRPAIRQKARDGFCPVGPWIVQREAIQDPDQLYTRVYINGELRQENTTANLIRPIAKLLAEVTDFMTLNEGDVLLAGVPENAPLAKAGDQVRIEIEGLGALENIVLSEGQAKEESQ
ncbi:fumarylacetoacetate hydrolase family protein [Pseudobacillus badius]|uniref:fumarylacetoacetate hydrolase family protein n=1 Tax=Bacillus badius TaxID=1455 RepID=UPI002E21DEE8|nr:fumarylacetoacetate hydrolase family protein [Bacillus badius]MED0667846.1 fumarylacetoacetate hydrolase family protein [Bacillus badius]